MKVSISKYRVSGIDTHFKKYHISDIDTFSIVFPITDTQQFNLLLINTHNVVRFLQESKLCGHDLCSTTQQKILVICTGVVWLALPAAIVLNA